MMFAENDRVMPKFFALWEGDPVELSTVMARSWKGHTREDEQFSLVELEVVG